MANAQIRNLYGCTNIRVCMGAKKTYTCANCSDTFEDYPSRREGRGRETFYCSRECKNEHARDGEYCECATCGSEVYVPKSHLEESSDGYSIDRHFCDKECESEYRKENWVGEDHPSWNGGLEEQPCETCGDVYEVKPSEKESSRFCSRECLSEWHSGQGDFNGPPKVDVECEYCGSEYEQRLKDNKKTDHSLCSEECVSEWLSDHRRGSNNPAWKGGKGGVTAVRRIIGDESWNQHAKQTRKNAGHICEMCNKFQPHRKLSAHHIIPVASGGVNEQWNLMALCETCHKKAETFINQYTEPNLLKYAPD